LKPGYCQPANTTTNAACADYPIGHYMAEAIFPDMLHRDPRGISPLPPGASDPGSVARPAGFSGRMETPGRGQLNVSEIAGDSPAVAISMACYLDSRTARDTVSKPGSQLGVDMTSNILREFWPDLERRFSRSHKSTRD